MSDSLLPKPSLELPPLLLGSTTPDVEAKFENFVFSIPAIYETWLKRRSSEHTRRAYHQDVMTFIQKFLRLRWPEESSSLLRVSVPEVQGYRDWLIGQRAAPKTVNRRISSLSSFYKYLSAASAEMRLPIIIPNPAHSQFIPRAESDPVQETKALTVPRARQLLGLPSGDSALEARDRAILKFYVYSGARLAAGCLLQVTDFESDERGATIRLLEKGNKRRTIGLHFAAAQAIREYTEKAGLTSGPLFRAQRNSRSVELGERGLKPGAMYRILQRYLAALPQSVRIVKEANGEEVRKNVYTPHSFRATAATLLLDAGVDICKVQELLGHRYVTTTQIYDKRRRRTSEGASHDVPI